MPAALGATSGVTCVEAEILTRGGGIGCTGGFKILDARLPSHSKFVVLRVHVLHFGPFLNLL